MRRTPDEITSEIFARSQQRIAKIKRRNKIIGTSVPLCCFVLVAGLLIGHGLPGEWLPESADTHTMLTAVTDQMDAPATEAPAPLDPFDPSDTVIERIDVEQFLSAKSEQILYGNRDSDPLIYAEDGLPDRNCNVIVNNGKGLTGGSLFIQKNLTDSMNQNADRTDVYFACTVFAIVDSNLVQSYTYEGKTVAAWREEMESKTADKINPYEKALKEMESRRDEISAAVAQDYLLTADQISSYFGIFKNLMGGRTQSFENGITLYDAIYLYSVLLRDCAVTLSNGESYLNFCTLIAGEYAKAVGIPENAGWSEMVSEYAALFESWLDFERSREPAAVCDEAVSAYQNALDYARGQYLMDWLNSKGIPCAFYDVAKTTNSSSTVCPYEGTFCIAYPTLNQLLSLKESPGMVLTFYQAT